MERNEKVTAEAIREQVATWIEQDGDGGGAWNMFTLRTLKDLKRDYSVTMEYLANITKEQFDYVCEAIDEVVYHFQSVEMVELIETLYKQFYGDDKSTALYRENIKDLKSCTKRA